jgi:hypothetical protein
VTGGGALLYQKALHEPVGATLRKQRAFRRGTSQYAAVLLWHRRRLALVDDDGSQHRRRHLELYLLHVRWQRHELLDRLPQRLEPPPEPAMHLVRVLPQLRELDEPPLAHRAAVGLLADVSAVVHQQICVSRKAGEARTPAQRAICGVPLCQDVGGPKRRKSTGFPAEFLGASVALERALLRVDQQMAPQVACSHEPFAARRAPERLLARGVE